MPLQGLPEDLDGLRAPPHLHQHDSQIPARGLEIGIDLQAGPVALLGACFASRDFSLRERIRYDFLMKLFGTRQKVPALPTKNGGGW